jgi:hypothetical protein
MGQRRGVRRQRPVEQALLAQPRRRSVQGYPVKEGVKLPEMPRLVE